MHPELEIRRLSIANAEALAEISAVTFHDTFAEFNTPEDMEAYRAEFFTIEPVRKELLDEGNEFYGAFLREQLIGYLKLILHSEGTFEIARLYVRKEYLSHKVGARLMAFSVGRARELGHSKLLLGVWEKNERAIAFYQRWGFRKTGEHEFILGQDVQTDWSMELEI